MSSCQWINRQTDNNGEETGGSETKGFQSSFLNKWIQAHWVWFANPSADISFSLGFFFPFFNPFFALCFADLFLAFLDFFGSLRVAYLLWFVVSPILFIPCLYHFHFSFFLSSMSPYLPFLLAFFLTPSPPFLPLFSSTFLLSKISFSSPPPPPQASDQFTP